MRVMRRSTKAATASPTPTKVAKASAPLEAAATPATTARVVHTDATTIVGLVTGLDVGGVTARGGSPRAERRARLRLNVEAEPSTAF